MIAIVGNIKIDETKPERINYLIACIRSYLFLKNNCKFILNLNNASEGLVEKVERELQPFSFLLWNEATGDYGTDYCQLLNYNTYDYVLNFMEDQFMVCDDRNMVIGLLNIMERRAVDVVKASFFHVEQNSKKDWIGGIDFPHYGRIYPNIKFYHDQYQKYYDCRYYIGCNFLTTKQFACKFWNRDLGNRPHLYEIARYSDQWLHTTMIPNFEIQCAIDDDHGESGTCLLKRTDCRKWNEIWTQVNQ